MSERKADRCVWTTQDGKWRNGGRPYCELPAGHEGDHSWVNIRILRERLEAAERRAQEAEAERDRLRGTLKHIQDHLEEFIDSVLNPEPAP